MEDLAHAVKGTTESAQYIIHQMSTQEPANLYMKPLAGNRIQKLTETFKQMKMGSHDTTAIKPTTTRVMTAAIIPRTMTQQDHTCTQHEWNMPTQLARCLLEPQGWGSNEYCPLILKWIQR